MLRWPIREGLLRYVHMLRERARWDYYVSLLAWAPQAPYIKGESKPPKPPRILRVD
ncbi:MAG TPA: hypothetical protein VF450_08310 [Noviherbaspirillum sp.]